MYLTSVLLVINENFDSVDTLEDNLKYAGSRVELIVYNNHCQNEKVLSSLKQLATKFIDNFTPIEFSFSECINELLRVASGEYISVFQDYPLLCENWLQKLLFFHNEILKSGVISVNEWSTNEIAYHLDKNDNLQATYSKDNLVNGVPFFRKDLIYSIGGFDPQLNGLYAIWDFCKRTSMNGFYNYFVPNTSMIKESSYKDTYETNLAFYKRYSASKNQESFIPIFTPLEQTPVVMEVIKKKINCSIQFSVKLGAIVFVKPSLNSEDLMVLSQILNEYQLSIELFSSSTYEENILKNSMVAIIR